jgi:competence protein ComEC
MSFDEHAGWFWKRPLLVVVLLLCIVDLVLLVALFRHERGVLTVSFLDVGQGDAVLIEAPNGNQLLYDAGPPSGAVLRELARVMPFYDRSIDVAVFSHPDMDHIGGFLDVLKRYKVDVMMESGAVSDNGIYDATVVAIANENGGRLLARKGMTINLGSGVFADILYPDRDMATMDTNSASIVMRVRYGDTAFLFSGDLPKGIEEYQASILGEGLRANVLKLGHHGSHTSSSEYWLTAVDPEIAVISAAKDNSYGHPHPDVLALLSKLAIPHLGTYDEGTIMFESDGTRVVRKD